MRACEPMPGLRLAIMLCAVSAAAGCLLRSDRPSASTARSLPPVQPAEGAYIEWILLERPLGDPFLDRDLWNDTLPIGSAETQALLVENGLRAGVLAGNLRPRFQQILESETGSLNGRGLTFGLRKDEVLPTNGPTEKCEFAVLTDLAGKRTHVALTQARCGVLVRPEALPDGRVRVTCEPQIQHGEKQERFRATADVPRLVKYLEVPLVRYPAF